MKPVAVFQHTAVGAPGAVLPILAQLGVDVRLVRILDGEAVPADVTQFAGLVFMGGYMSVHDPLPWIAQELQLIRAADAQGIPLAGHCLGSQLIALGLGGQVAQHTQPEIGWGTLLVDADATTRDWFGPLAGRELETFQWHGDTFTPPAGARQLARSRYCENQVFVHRDRHLLVQSHLEMTPALVELSLEVNGHQLVRQHELGNPAVQSLASTRERITERTQAMNGVLHQLYRRWVQGLAH